MPLIHIMKRTQHSPIHLHENDITKQYVNQSIQAEWNLVPSEYTLTYLDFDGDEITAEIEEDFEVARVTMSGEKFDTLKFMLTLKD